MTEYRIEEIKTVDANGDEKVIYKVKYCKIGWFGPSWKYITWYAGRSDDPVDREYSQLEIAQRAIRDHRADNNTPKVTTRDLDEEGKPIFQQTGIGS